MWYVNKSSAASLAERRLCELGLLPLPPPHHGRLPERAIRFCQLQLPSMPIQPSACWSSPWHGPAIGLPCNLFPLLSAQPPPGPWLPPVFREGGFSRLRESVAALCPARQCWLVAALAGLAGWILLLRL
ncbi:uncharacterized protein LOC134531242 isoform X2 [Bacillus rossius redtenbacheri]|uniref:uncharacterized protein LOC134531242 isoform X2 n=1 Tax=Bacillus rossius redtenbacheri TaxID=93214 RepID=UPI002FDEC29C